MKPAILSRLAATPFRRTLIGVGTAGPVIAALVSHSRLSRVSGEAERESALRNGKAAEPDALAAYLSRNPKAGVTPRTMEKISELGNAYLGNLPPEKRLEKAIGIIADHARHPEKTKRLREEINKAEQRLKALEAEREKFLKSNPGRPSDSFERTGDFRKMESIRNNLRKMYQEMLIHYGFLAYCNEFAGEEKAGKK